MPLQPFERKLTLLRDRDLLDGPGPVEQVVGAAARRDQGILLGFLEGARYIGQRSRLALLLRVEIAKCPGQCDDIVSSLQGKALGNFLIIPNEAILQRDRLLVDNLTVDSLSSKLDLPVYPSGRTTRDFFDLLSTLGKTDVRARRS